MSDDNSDEIPPPPRIRPGIARASAFGVDGPPGTGAPRADQEEEDVNDEDTWVAAGSPYFSRERTSETYFEDDPDHHTNVEWNASSSPGSRSFGSAEDPYGLEHRPPTNPLIDGTPNEFPTEPGFGADQSLSALRDAMRTSASVRQQVMASPPAPLPIPTPRVRAVDAPRPMPPPPRRGIGLSPPRAVGGGVRTLGGSRRNGGLMAIFAPVGVAAIVVLFLATLALRLIVPSEEVVIEAPMLPVVGGPAPQAMPDPPFDVPAPPPFEPQRVDAEADPADVPVRVMEARAAGDLRLAAAWSDLLVRRENRPDRFFRHASLLAASGDMDASLYWLVRAVQEHGVPPEWLVADASFARLWGDARWDPLIRWIILAKRHHAARGASPATIVLPQDMQVAANLEAARNGKPAATLKQGATPTLPVLIWLDDVAGNGSTVLTWGQQIADQEGMLVLGLGGPERIGPAGSWWTSDPARDFKHIENALAAIPGATPDPKRRYLVGVGQGAQYAVELMLRAPEFAAAGLAIAPTDDWRGARDKAGEGRRDRTQKAVLMAGALDGDAHTLLRLDRGRMMRAGIEVEMIIEEQPWAETPPADLGDRVTSWVHGLLSPGDAGATDQGNLAGRTE